MSAQQKERSLATLAAMQFAAGGCAGFVEVSIMHPLDLVKTRFQIQRGPEDPNRYTSIVDCFRKMYRNEGALSFYKGILPPLLAETPKRATKFFTFERYKNAFGYGSYLPQSWVFTLSGLCSGLTEAVVINPFEVVKVKLQAERDLFKKQKSTFTTAREIVRENGLGTKGLNKGLTATLGRHGVFNMIYFSFYHNIKGIIPEAKDPSLDVLRRFLIGLCSGVLGSVINIPFDVAKSRIQGPQPVPGQIKYRTCFATIVTVYKEEGKIEQVELVENLPPSYLPYRFLHNLHSFLLWEKDKIFDFVEERRYFALYKGLLPKVLRLGPGGAIMFLVYEHVFEWLQHTF